MPAPEEIFTSCTSGSSSRLMGSTNGSPQRTASSWALRELRRFTPQTFGRITSPPAVSFSFGKGVERWFQRQRGGDWNRNPSGAHRACPPVRPVRPVAGVLQNGEGVAVGFARAKPRPPHAGTDLGAGSGGLITQKSMMSIIMVVLLCTSDRFFQINSTASLMSSLCLPSTYFEPSDHFTRWNL